MNAGFLTVVMVTGGAIFLASRGKKKKPAMSEHSAEDIVVYDLYPDGVAAEQVVSTPKTSIGIAASPNCSTIAVGHDWWEQVARPMASKLVGNPDDIALQVIEAELASCTAVEPTEAINQFYDDLIKAVQTWRSGPASLQPSQSEPASLQPLQPKAQPQALPP